MIALEALSVDTRAGSTTFCRDRDGVRSWEAWQRDVDSLAEVLSLASATRWAVYTSSTYEFAVALFALWSTGKVPVVPTANNAATSESLAAHVEAYLGEFPNKHALGVLGHPAPARRGRLAVPAASSLVLFTSGSSGEPKPIAKALSQLDHEIAGLDRLWGEHLRGAHVLATVSHQHIYGLLFKLLWPICAGAPFFSPLIRSLPQLRTITNALEHCTWVASPAQLKRAPREWLRTVDFSRVAAIYSSGGPLPPTAAHLIEEMSGRAPFEAYGSTECGGIAYRQQAVTAPDIPWTPFPGVEIETRSGALYVRSRHLPDDEWHASGDLATVDAAGFRLGARADQLVKIEEKRVSLAAIEAAIATRPGVRQAKCALVPGRRESLGAVVELDPTGFRELHRVGKRKFAATLRSALTKRFDPVTLPKRWRFVDTLSSNAQGKLVQAEVLAQLTDEPTPALPDVVEVTKTTVTARLELRLSASLPYFDGHFPGTPVLPGVVQLLWADHFARRELGARPMWRGVEGLKFSRVIRPGDRVTLSLEVRDADRLMFEYACDGHTCSTGRLTAGS